MRMSMAVRVGGNAPLRELRFVQVLLLAYVKPHGCERSDLTGPTVFQ
jgi:hypothetical protein